MITVRLRNPQNKGKDTLELYIFLHLLAKHAKLFALLLQVQSGMDYTFASNQGPNNPKILA
mgnify:CR=1 FL=1